MFLKISSINSFHILFFVKPNLGRGHPPPACLFYIHDLRTGYIIFISPFLAFFNNSLLNLFRNFKMCRQHFGNHQTWLWPYLTEIFSNSEIGEKSRLFTHFSAPSGNFIFKVPQYYWFLKVIWQFRNVI